MGRPTVFKPEPSSITGGITMKNLMKVGPKGQVVVPQELRREMNIMPGSHVYFQKEKNRLYLKSAEDPIEVFERIANSGPSLDMKDFDPHEAYEASMRSRMHAWVDEK